MPSEVMCWLLKSCVQLLWWIAKHKMDDKCMLDEWNVVQKINVCCNFDLIISQLYYTTTNEPCKKCIN